MPHKPDLMDQNKDCKTRLKTYKEPSQFKLPSLKLLATRNKETKLYGMMLLTCAEASMLNMPLSLQEEDKKWFWSKN